MRGVMGRVVAVNQETAAAQSIVPDRNQRHRAGALNRGVVFPADPVDALRNRANIVDRLLVRVIAPSAGSRVPGRDQLTVPDQFSRALAVNPCHARILIPVYSSSPLLFGPNTVIGRVISPTLGT